MPSPNPTFSTFQLSLSPSSSSTSILLAFPSRSSHGPFPSCLTNPSTVFSIIPLSHPIITPFPSASSAIGCPRESVVKVREEERKRALSDAVDFFGSSVDAEAIAVSSPSPSVLSSLTSSSTSDAPDSDPSTARITARSISLRTPSCRRRV